MNAPAGPALDPVRAALDRALHALAAVGPDLAAHANRIGEILWSPPRIVVVGRLKAGKSTLVNALIGASVADTAALEATAIVSVYQDGAPARTEAVLLDGTRRPVDTVRGAITALDIAPHEIAYLHRRLPSAAIRDYTLIDTPGLATLTTENETRTRRVLIDGFEQTRTASVDADAAVFLFDSAPRADELDFLRHLGFTPLTTLGVLSRADGFGEGALGGRDPLEHAEHHAATLAAQLSETVMTVLPIAGLLAETSHTGAVTEQDTRALAALVDIEPFDLIDLLDSGAHDASDGIGAGGSVSIEVRNRLLDLLGEYGIVHGRTIARGGAAALNDWLVARSGVPRLRSVLRYHLGSFAHLHRAGRIIGELERLAYTHPDRGRIRAIVDTLRTDPALHTVVLFGHLKAMLDADPTSPVTTELRRLIEYPHPAAALGLPPTATGADIRAEAQRKLTWVHTCALSTLTSAEDAALVSLIHTYGLMLR
ncbi:GTPase [Rhodococcus sp. 1168]|uniref:GTPase n=1 Tax=Rhodococcus sp. 1168 TaxID=2018041 RepID=UPI000A0B3205|nr:GTPase [Rhodococcus sp. 1168]ORI14805.1 GTPase [Rhodococcus sp. 1168]